MTYTEDAHLIEVREGVSLTFTTLGVCFSINCVALSNLRYTCWDGTYSVGICAVLDTFRLGLV